MEGRITLILVSMTVVASGCTGFLAADQGSAPAGEEADSCGRGISFPPGADVRVSDFGVSRGELALTIRGSGPGSLRVESIEIEDAAGKASRKDVGKELGVGGTYSTSIPGVSRSDNCSRYTVNIYLGSGEKVSGEITGFFDIS